MICAIIAAAAVSAIIAVFVTKVLPALGNDEPSGRHGILWHEPVDRGTEEGGGEWLEHRPWPWQKITFIDGTNRRFALPVLRRRTLGGDWQYREYSADEIVEWQKDQAW